MNKTNTSANEPQLAPPGAGIPYPAKLILRFFVRPWVAEKAPWEESEERFQIITQKILKMVDDLSEEQKNKKILIPRIRGLEDSSRFWSVNMTLEHLQIVGDKIIEATESLDRGEAPCFVADTATVKPTGKKAEPLMDFKDFVARHEALLPRLNRGHKNLRFIHPWFGAMNSRGWYWLLATHQGIHYKQISLIIEGLTLQPDK